MRVVRVTGTQAENPQWIVESIRAAWARVSRDGDAAAAGWPADVRMDRTLVLDPARGHARAAEASGAHALAEDDAIWSLSVALPALGRAVERRLRRAAGPPPARALARMEDPAEQRAWLAQLRARCRESTEYADRVEAMTPAAYQAEMERLLQAYRAARDTHGRKHAETLHRALGVLRLHAARRHAARLCRYAAALARAARLQAYARLAPAERGEWRRLEYRTFDPLRVPMPHLMIDTLDHPDALPGIPWRAAPADRWAAFVRPGGLREALAGLAADRGLSVYMDSDTDNEDSDEEGGGAPAPGKTRKRKQRS